MAAIDLRPTLASLTHVACPPATCDGEDLSAALLGTPMKRTKPLFWEYGVYGSIKPGKPEHVSPQLAMRDGDWKLLCNPDGSALQLYNLRDDIGEQLNLAQQRTDVVDRMKPQLDAWWAEMDAYYANIQ